MHSSNLISHLSSALLALTLVGTVASCGVEPETEATTEATTEAAVISEPGTAALTWYQVGRDNCYDVWGMACNGTHPTGKRCSSAVAGQPCSTPTTCYKVVNPWFYEFECR